MAKIKIVLQCDCESKQEVAGLAFKATGVTVVSIDKNLVSIHKSLVTLEGEDVDVLEVQRIVKSGYRRPLPFLVKCFIYKKGVEDVRVMHASTIVPKPTVVPPPTKSAQPQKEIEPPKDKELQYPPYYPIPQYEVVYSEPRFFF